MGSFAKDVIENWGTIGLLLVIFIESGVLPVPLPGDSLLFLAGFYASTAVGGSEPHLDLLAVTIGSFIAAVLGAQIGYGIGWLWGTNVFKPDAKIFKTKYLERSHEFFERRGVFAVILARFVPFVRTIVPLLAGASKMKARTFTIANIVGALVWAVGISLLGYGLGHQIGEKWIEPITVGIVALSLIPPLLEWRKHRREEKAHAAAEPAAVETVEP